MTQSYHIYLDEHSGGLSKVRQLLLDSVYRNRTYVTPLDRTPRPITADEVEHRDIFELFLILARQSKFPVPEPTGNVAPVRFEEPTPLPSDLNIRPGRKSEYYDAIDNLFNVRNRRIGSRK